ncbi:MAG: hypothetical protein ACLR8H_01750 [Clostridium sp.]
MEVLVDFSSFYNVEIRIGNKIELKSDDGSFKGEMSHDFIENLFATYISQADENTIKELVSYAEEELKEREKDEISAREIVNTLGGKNEDNKVSY